MSKSSFLDYEFKEATELLAESTKGYVQPYDRHYFNTKNYQDYMHRAERYERTASEIIDLTTKLCLIDKESYILDYGCAVGFLMQGFIKHGYNNIYGHDVSDWATEYYKSKGLKSFYDAPIDRPPFDLIIALDVFEHMIDDEVMICFEKCDSNALIVRIPVSIDNGKTFCLTSANDDETHVNCKSAEAWQHLLKAFGYTVQLKLNMYTIYNSPGVLCMLCLKG